MKLISHKLKFIAQGFPYKPPDGCFGYSTCVLVEDEGKKILFDTGSYSLRKPVIELINNNTIDFVVISHLHFDHCSNLDLFVGLNTQIIFSQNELDYYFEFKNKDLDLFSYLDLIKSKLNIKTVNEGYNLTKNCKIVYTPGHTKGHISLEVNLDAFKVFICGDSIKTRKEVKKFPSSTNAFDILAAKETREFILKNYKYLVLGHDLFYKGKTSFKKLKLRRV